MRSRTLSILAVLGLAVGGTIAYQSVQQQRVAALLETQTTALAAAYTTLANETITPLSGTGNLTAVQQRTINRITETLSTMNEDIGLTERVNAIGSLQASLTGFAHSVTPDQPFADSESLLHLQEEVSEQSSMLDLLQNYNDTAKRWNATVQSDLGSIVGQISGTEQSLLPFLRFDGKTEFVPVISL